MKAYEDLLRYYQSELGYLKQSGQEFARQYPKIAARLELTPDGSSDPHIERLISSFAFLTARIQRQINAEFPQISSALLGALQPQLANPVPTMAVAAFDVDPARGKITSGFPVPRETQLFAQSGTGLFCRFRTCYDVTLWPLEVASASIDPPAQFSCFDGEPNVAGVLRLRMRAMPGIELPELEMRKLRFYIDGDAALANTVYELLFAHALRAGILPDDGGAPVWLPAGSLEACGFTEDEEVIPCPPNALPGYRLVQEYFLFPEKFLFFEVDGVHLHRSRQYFDLVFPLDRIPRQRFQVQARNFRLGCTPVINLFSKTSEPIRADSRAFEYRLVADFRKEKTTEIHSVLAVSASSDPNERTRRLEPFFSHRHRFEGPEPRSFWYTRRIPAEREEMSGTEVMLSFVDLDFHPSKPPVDVVYAHLMCTNRDFAAQLPAGAVLQVESAGPFAAITCLTKPTWPVYPPLGGSTVWQLISSQTLNYLSLSGDEASLEALREVLKLYSLSDRPSVYQSVQGVSGLECRRVTRRVGADAWRGYCQGTEITVTLDEAMYVGSGAFLFGGVLNHFFALYAGMNSFTELVLKSRQREGAWKRFAPLAGTRGLL